MKINRKYSSQDREGTLKQVTGILNLYKDIGDKGFGPSPDIYKP